MAFTRCKECGEDLFSTYFKAEHRCPPKYHYTVPTPGTAKDSVYTVYSNAKTLQGVAEDAAAAFDIADGEYPFLAGWREYIYVWKAGEGKESGTLFQIVGESVPDYTAYEEE